MALLTIFFYSQEDLMRKEKVDLSTIGGRVKFARLNKGLKQHELAKMVNYKQPSICAIEKGEVKWPVDIEKFSAVLGVSQAWLQLGITETSELKILNDHPRIAIISWNDVLNYSSVIDDYSYNLDDSNSVLPITGDASLIKYALRIKNDSMCAPIGSTPSFPPGTVIGVDPNKEPTDGKFILCFPSNSNEPLFRQLIIDGCKKYLKALNPLYPLIEIDTTSTICGVIVQASLPV